MYSLTQSVAGRRTSLESAAGAGHPDIDKVSHGLVIESLFKNTLSQEELFVLIESGIKFFLFQRGQIPLPYERLRASKATSTSCSSSSANNTNTRNNPNNEEGDSDFTRFDDGDTRLTKTNELGEDREGTEIASGWRRIRMLKKEGKAKRYEMLMTRKYNKVVEKEVVARAIWSDVFLRLRTLFLSSPKLNITNIVIFFGPSIFNPKEMITFEIDPLLPKNFKDVTPEDEKNQHAVGSESADFTPTLRNFYRSLIMSPEYLEFTTKPLRSTCSHVCILTSEMISDDSLRENLVLVENFYSLHPESRFGKLSVKPSHHSSKFHGKKKRLKVSMALKSVNPELSTVKVERDNNDTSNHSFKADNKNNFCYQIPMNFRGIAMHK